MSLCACARSRSYCELRGCRSHGGARGGYYADASGKGKLPPWEPRYVAVAVGPDAMVLVDTAHKKRRAPRFDVREVGWNVEVSEETRDRMWKERGAILRGSEVVGRIVSPPGAPEVVVETLFEWNRTDGGYREVEFWSEEARR